MPGYFPLPSNLGTIKRVVGADPAAGSEISDAVPSGKSWVLIGVRLVLVQGITQTPQPILQFQDAAGNVLFESVGSTAAQAVSTTCAYNFGADLIVTGQLGAGANVRSNAAIPGGFVLGAGFQIKTVTLGIGANSDYGPASYYVCELG